MKLPPIESLAKSTDPATRCLAVVLRAYPGRGSYFFAPSAIGCDKSAFCDKASIAVARAYGYLLQCAGTDELVVISSLRPQDALRDVLQPGGNQGDAQGRKSRQSAVQGVEEQLTLW